MSGGDERGFEGQVETCDREVALVECEGSGFFHVTTAFNYFHFIFGNLDGEFKKILEVHINKYELY